MSLGFLGWGITWYKKFRSEHFRPHRNLVKICGKMAFILGVRRKTARQPHGGFAANFWFFIQPWGIRNDLESIRKCFSFGKIRNLEKTITCDYSRVSQFPVFRSGREVEKMTLHNVRVNSIYPQSFIQIGPLVSEILSCTRKMNPISVT